MHVRLTRFRSQLMSTDFMLRRQYDGSIQRMRNTTLYILSLRMWNGRAQVDGFIIALAGVVVAATVLPCRGDSARAFHAAGNLAIAALFFLQGARLSRDAIVLGMTRWRLHAAIGATTFVLFPLLGLGLFAAAPHLLPQRLFLGVLFVCALPSTVQSSIALTSIAGGNVPGAICAATVSNIAGIALAPLWFGAMSHLRGGGIDLVGVWQVSLQLLLPFAAGHALRPFIGAWAERNRSVLSITDRGSILLVIYAAFSAAVVRGIWQQVPPARLAELALLMVALLGLILLITTFASRWLGLGREDQAALVFCGSQKSLVSGVPIANALVSGAAIGPLLLPIMLYHPLQILVCAWLARRYASAGARGTTPTADQPLVAMALASRPRLQTQSGASASR
jgi:solute carrier family 10 (sodium/bile acid cotransporter), member 7